jgi:hypothetical protein
LIEITGETLSFSFNPRPNKKLHQINKRTFKTILITKNNLITPLSIIQKQAIILHEDIPSVFSIGNQTYKLSNMTRVVG